MTELIIYAGIFLLLIAHALLAGKMYRAVHEDTMLGMKEKNDWKLKALIFPGFYWFQYKASKK